MKIVDISIQNITHVLTSTLSNISSKIFSAPAVSLLYTVWIAALSETLSTPAEFTGLKRDVIGLASELELLYTDCKGLVISRILNTKYSKLFHPDI